MANERLTKDSPVELEAGQSLRFAASTRTYILRKNDAALFSRPPLPTEVDLPPPPDPSDEEAVVSYNTLLNRLGLTKSGLPSSSEDSSLASGKEETQRVRPTKKLKKMRVAFRDQLGGELVEVVGFSDGADVGTEPGPIGVKEGSLVGKYESLVQSTIIPKGKDQSSLRGDGISSKGVTGKLQEILNRVKNPSRSGIYDDLYGESFSGNVGSSWAYSSEANKPSSPPKDSIGKASSGNHEENNRTNINNDSDDDLFGN